MRSGPEDAYMCEDCLADFETIRDDFASLDDWEDRYRYVIELGHTLEPLGEAARNESNKVRGCVSQVWLEREARTSVDGEAILHYRGDSDSHLVPGLIAISISLFSDRAPKQILAVDALRAFRALGLEQHLTPQRSNGARAMIERIRATPVQLSLGRHSSVRSHRDLSNGQRSWRRFGRTYDCTRPGRQADTQTLAGGGRPHMFYALVSSCTRGSAQLRLPT
jgi:cysteine desulfuration protein SufE